MADITIAQVREKYPQYSDMSDAQLADALHAKFYSDMDRGDFYKKIGLSGEQAKAPEPVEESWLQGAALKAGKFLSETAAEGAGMIGGARVGATVGAAAGPMGAIAGGVLGAGLGYGASKYAESKVGGEPVSWKTPIEGMAYEMGGQSVGYGISKLWGATVGKILPKRDPALVALYKKYNIDPLPSEVSPTSKTATVMESALGYHPISGDIVIEHKFQRMDQYNQIYKRISDLGASTKDRFELATKIRNEAQDIIAQYTKAGDEEVSKLTTKFMDQMGIPQPSSLSLKHAGGNFIKQNLEDTKEAMRKSTEDAYKAVDELLGKAKGEKVALSPNTMNTAARLLEYETSKAPALQNRKIIKALKGFIAPEEEFITVGGTDVSKAKVLEMPDGPAKTQLLSLFEGQAPGYTWDGMKGNVSVLKERVRDIYTSTKGKGTDESRMYQEMIDSLEGNMEVFAKSKGDDIWSAYTKAKAASYKYHDLFDKDVLGIMNLSGEQLIKKLTASPVDFLNQVRQVGGDDTIGVVKLLYLQDTYTKSLAKDGKLDPVKFMSNLRKIGQDKLNVLIPQEQQRLLDAYTKKLNLLGDSFFGSGKMKELELLNVLTNTSNEGALDYIIKTKNPNVIKYVKNIMSEERLLDIQEAAVRRTLVTNPAGNFMPGKAAKEFYGNEKTLKALLPEDVFNEVKSFIKVTENDKKVQALAENASHTGQVMIGHSMLTHPMTALKTMGLSWVIAKIYFNDAARTLFVRALKAPANNPQAIADFTKAWSLAIGNVLTQQDIPEGIGL